MKTSRVALSTALVAALTLTACGDMTNDPNRNAKTGAAVGAGLGGLVGALFGDDPEGRRTGALAGAIIGAGAGAAVGSRLDQQEADLRQQLGNDRVDIENTGDSLVVTLPQDILFATDSANLRPDLRADLRTVAGSLQAYPDTTVQVIGHTDNVGDPGYNIRLSERRAQSVADVLRGEGVAASRIRTLGQGDTQPVASNLTAEGRQQNRRVEIVILPNG